VEDSATSSIEMSHGALTKWCRGCDDSCMFAAHH